MRNVAVQMYPATTRIASYDFKCLSFGRTVVSANFQGFHWPGNLVFAST